KFKTKHANHDLENKFSHWANMIDKGDGKDELYFLDGQDLKTAEYVAQEKDDKRPFEYLEKAHESALRGEEQNDPRIKKEAKRHMDRYAKIQFRENGFYGEHIDLTNDESIFKSIHQMSA